MYNIHIIVFLFFFLPVQSAFAQWGTHESPACLTSNKSTNTLLKNWANLKYSWYAQLPETNKGSHAIATDFFKLPHVKKQIKNFHLENAEAIQNFRYCQFLTWQVNSAQLPNLNLYEKVSTDTSIFYTSDVSGIYGVYPKLMFEPLVFMNFAQSILLAKALGASEMGQFYLRRAIGGSRIMSERLKNNRWRVWLDSYDYVLTIDMDVIPESFKVNGLWKRKLPSE